jgi:para-nitrobenzyl esterase
MNDILQTPCGAIRGTTCQWPGVRAYKGIRYATAQRWQRPVLVTHWDDVYDATEYGACCYQPRAFYDESATSEKAFYYNEFRRGEEYTYSEDCLFLNIWTPDGATPGSALPVVLYIHGGGFVGGCGHEKHFDGPVWPTQGVIAVTINYRLGPLGFGCPTGHTGNYGLFDQLAALQWVRRNIAAFGGDANKITLMGQSAGAMSVQLLCTSPLTDGLISGAVMCSGGGASKFLGPSSTPESLHAAWDAVAQAAGCANAAELETLPAEKLFEAWQTARKTTKGLRAAPCLDGELLVESCVSAADAGRHRNVPYMVGSNSEDVMPPFLYKIGKSWCERQATQGLQDSYTYHFDRQLPGDDNGAWHSADLWYWFGTLDNCWRPMTEKDQHLSAQMVRYLANFAHTGNPNDDAMPTWEPARKGQRKVMRFGEAQTNMGRTAMLKMIVTMFTNKAVGE